MQRKLYFTYGGKLIFDRYFLHFFVGFGWNFVWRAYGQILWSNSFIVFEFRENGFSEKHTLRRA